MIDLHVHILPGLDDGAADMTESLEMAELAYESGVRRIVATPHSNQIGRFENFYSENLIQVYEKFCHAVKQEKIPLRIDLGMEIFSDGKIENRIIQNELIGLHNSSVYLVEFPFDSDPYWMGEQMEALLEINKIPLIAHPERYFCVQDHPNLVYEWIRLGCYSQINRGSILGRFGKRVYKTSQILMEHDLITCVASDAHSSYARTTYMEDIWNYIEEYYGEDVAYRLLRENPQRILEKKYIPVHGKNIERKRKFFW